MPLYPLEIKARSAAPSFSGRAAGCNAVGTSASFACGSFVRFYLAIGREDLTIRDMRYATNGCGYAVAAADTMAGFCTGKHLPELGGLTGIISDAGIEEDLGDFPSERQQCLNTCVEALRLALSDFRSLQIEEFAGEKALICTCFGVEEATIEAVAADQGVKTVADVTSRTKAGAGCGSCRMLIQEIIDGRETGVS